MSESQNNFFLLHGVTSSWALSNIIPLVKSTDKKLEILQIFLCLLLAVYIAKDRPKLYPDFLESPDVADLTWEEIKSRTLNLPVSTDEHEYKLIQVLPQIKTNLLFPFCAFFSFPVLLSSHLSPWGPYCVIQCLSWLIVC